MAKVIKGVVAVIGAVASVLAVIPSPIQPIAAIVAAGAAVASAALNIMLPAKPRSPALSGSQTAFRLDPQAGIPYVIGRTLFGGLGIHRDTWGTDNQYHGIVVAWSGGGPVDAIEQFQVDTVPTNFGGGGAAVGGFAGFMWLATQLGATPSGALASPVGGFPGWGANQKLSGYAAGIWVCMFDKKGKKFAAGLPKIAAVIRGPKCYDPRLDSTYPGGAGPCRVGDQATYVYSENPWIQAINWALGRWANGQKVLGVGMGVGSIVMASFVSAANVADANNWKAGGVVSSVDDKWEVLKMLSQAGGGECVRLGGKLSAFVNAPRVSIATIETGDLVGDAKIATTQFIRSRVNGVVPVMRLESHGWEQVPGAPVRFDPYVVEDGGRRTVETEFVLVQQLKQGAELAAYEVVNAREFGPIDLQLKLRWLGIEPGDLVTLNIPAAGLAGQKCLALARSLDPTSANVALSLRSETDAKHALALGKTTTVPASPSLTPIDLSIVPAPGALAWTVLPAVITGPDGGQFPILRARGATDNPTASNVVFEYRPVAVPVGAMPGAPVIGQTAIDANGAQFVWEAPGVWARVWIMQATQDAGVTEQEFPSVTPLTQYQIAVSYVSRGVLGARLVLGPVTTAENIGTGRLWIQTAAPSREESAAGDIWIDDTGFYWVRREEVYLSIGGDRLMIGGDLLTITWTPADSQPIINQVGSALQVALNAANAASALAQNALTVADGKINSFYLPDPPAGVGESEGDLWFDTNDGKKQYRYTSGAWVSAQDTAIGAALDAAADADAKADSKVVTFVQEGTPTAEGDGDLWFKQSLGELRRWNEGGATWGDPLVDLTSAAIPRHEPTSAALSFTGSSTGVIDPADQLPETLLVQRFVGSTDVSGDAGTTWTVDYVEGATGATPTVSDGELTLPTGLVISPSGALVRVKSERDGFVLYTDVTLSQTNAPPNSNGSGTGGTTVNDSTIDGVSTTSLVKVSDTMTVKTGSTGVIDFAGVLSITGTKAAPIGSFGAVARWRYRQLPAGSWTWAGAQIDDTVPLVITIVSGEPPNPSYFERSVGQINIARSQTGLAANTDHEVELHAARDSASGTRTISFGGTASATGK